MNYRHSFHAGNFGDVFKHALLMPLIRGMQRKEKGFAFVDTHAGLGSYDLEAEAPGRTREYLDGIGRLGRVANPPAALEPFLELVRAFNSARGGPADAIRFYPGSPWIAARLRRPQDRLALSELHPEDFETLRAGFFRERGVGVQRIDAYSALKAHLPNPERRALALIDPPYEDANEVSHIHAAIESALGRMPAATIALWYPIKDRSANEAFKALLGTLPLPPTLCAELLVRRDDRPALLNGCGLAVLNPPWRIEEELAPIVAALEPVLAVESGARSGIEWLVEES